MEKSKRILIVLIILLIMIAVIATMLINTNKKNENSHNNTQTSIDVEPDEAFVKVNNYKTYFTVKEIIENYILYMKQINGDEYVDASTFNMTVSQIAQTMQEDGLEALKGILDESYLKDETDNSLIKIQNEYKQDGTYSKQVIYNLNIDNMYKYNIDNNISLVLVEAKLNNIEFDLLVKLDNVNNTYSIFLNDFITKNDYGKHMSARNITISKTKIQKNNYNSDISVEGTERDVVIQYFSDYRMKMLNDTEAAYQKLDSEYAEKKFGQYSNFKNYVDNNKNSIEVASIDKYQVVENKTGKEYVCVDENGKYYIFIEKEVGKYSVVLDTYTINLPEFLEKYNSSNDQTKVGLNIQKIFDAINNEDYEFVYNKLDETFKQNNFKTLQEFANYAVQNFAGKQLKYGKCQQQGSMYIFDITIASGTNQTNKRIIMKLNDEADFVMSFNVN